MRLRAGALSTSLLALVATGCGSSAPGNERFYPADGVARSALASALELWRKGGADGVVPGADSPRVQVVDQSRIPGQKLVAFQILGGLPADGPPVFAVRLTTEPPMKPDVTRYVVVGVDPLWVFRQTDFDKMAHWEMNMTHDDVEPGAGASKQ